ARGLILGRLRYSDPELTPSSGFCSSSRRMIAMICVRIIAVCVLLLLLFPAHSESYRQPIKWKEKNNEIIHSSVCFNHRRGSVEYRQCRVDAKRYFNAQCNLYREKYDNSTSGYETEVKRLRDKFCYSANQFAPV
ncbi:hypothetical protein, partial [Sedimenticola hydrogenitrophicus]|uniref:hypothetical protein n=1 Tax=Sedimenticola hydrogenitrophicus TaxID=2967975 RepID=UPI002FF7CF1C